MGFLRRLFGGDDVPTASTSDDGLDDVRPVEDDDDAAFDDPGPPDELIERQIRYAAYAWTPPAQGGERRADDVEED